MIPYGRQYLDEEDIEAVVRALKSDYLTTGPEVEAFENEMAAYVGAEHAVAFCNATAALHVAMLVAGIGPGDRVVTSPNTFLASANCAAFVGAVPDFSDIDPVSYNLCPEKLDCGWKPDTRAVVAVDYGGQPANLPAIAEVARRNGAVVIEDGCHAIGGKFRSGGKTWMTGGHPWADMTVFSFHPVKTLTTGEGGMILTGNAEYARRARLLRSHGMERDPERLAAFGREAGPFREAGPWIYEMQELGFNYRITDLQCALGRSQLKKLPQFVERRRAIVAAYNQAFRDLSWLTTPGLAESPDPGTFAMDPDELAWHLYTVQIDFSALGKTRTEAMHQLRESGVGSQVLYIPVYLQPWYRQTYGYGPGKCPVVEAFYARALSLPLFPAMQDKDVESVIKAVKKLSDA